MSPTKPHDPARDEHWRKIAAHWDVRPDTTYLNHGSFGLPPKCVRDARTEFIHQLNANPMDFYLRQLEKLMADARIRLSQFVGTTSPNLVFVDNATYAMNVVADSFPLEPHDEVLLTDHEYGAVHRIWERRCNRSGAKIISAELPKRFDSEQSVIDALLESVSEKTKLLIVSHVTSATALIMPAKKICEEFSKRGIAVCIDGPHAPAQIELNIDDLDCDFYTASCHKWICGTLGTGFLFAHPRWHDQMQPIMKSWGRLLPAIPQTWDEEFTWMGSRDPSGFLTVAVAIDFMESIGLDIFRQRTFALAAYAENSLVELFGTQPIGDRSKGWYGSMAHVPLPPGDWPNLQQQIWDDAGIEVMINFFDQRWFVRVSCHLYTDAQQIDLLIATLRKLIPTPARLAGE